MTYDEFIAKHGPNPKLWTVHVKSDGVTEVQHGIFDIGSHLNAMAEQYPNGTFTVLPDFIKPKE